MKNLFDYGGTAFPAEWKLPDGATASHPGMTLLDFYAGQALGGILANENWRMIASPQTEIAPDHKAVAKGVARTAYLFAAAMLKAREVMP